VTGNVEQWRPVAVFACGVAYWGTVLFNAVRVRRLAGHMPAIRPHGVKEQCLWAGWFCVSAGWLAQPLLILEHPEWPVLAIMNFLDKTGIAVLGSTLAILGYAGTIWCYAVLGSAWGLSSQKKAAQLVDRGPYRRMRHPIYAFQLAIFFGMLCILPTRLFLALLVLLVACVVIKSVDEERALSKAHGKPYRDYMSRTGRFW